MSRRYLGIVLSVAILGGCEGTSSTTPASTAGVVPTIVATPSATPESTPTPTPTSTPIPTPMPTPKPKSIDDLLADPVPTVTATDLQTLDPLVAQYVDAEAGKSELYQNSKMAAGTWLCQASLRGAPPRVRELERLTGCLLAMGIRWQRYLSFPMQSAFDDARLVYAYGASQTWTGGRAAFDAAVRTALSSLAVTPPAPPARASLESVDAFLATKPKTLTAIQLENAVYGAITTNFTWAVEGSTGTGDPGWGEPGVVGSTHKGRLFMQSTVGACAYQFADETLGASGCNTLIWKLRRGYLATGNAGMYAAAVDAYSYSFGLLNRAGRPVIADNNANEYVDQLRRFLK